MNWTETALHHPRKFHKDYRRHIVDHAGRDGSLRARLTSAALRLAEPALYVMLIPSFLLSAALRKAGLRPPF